MTATTANHYRVFCRMLSAQEGDSIVKWGLATFITTLLGILAYMSIQITALSERVAKLETLIAYQNSKPIVAEVPRWITDEIQKERDRIDQLDRDFREFSGSRKR